MLTVWWFRDLEGAWQGQLVCVPQRLGPQLGMLEDWALEWSEGSGTHMSGGWCWLSAKTPTCGLSVWAILRFLRAWRLSSQSKCCRLQEAEAASFLRLGPGNVQCHFYHILLVKQLHSRDSRVWEDRNLTSWWEESQRIWGPCFKSATAHDLPASSVLCCV